MHELGVVFRILDEVEDIAAENGIARVSSVTLEVGEVSTIVPELLADCWRWACSKREAVRGCGLEIERIPAITRCEACSSGYKTVEHGKVCPVCGSGDTYLIQWDETLIKEIVTPEAPPDAREL